MGIDPSLNGTAVVAWQKELDPELYGPAGAVLEMHLTPKLTGMERLVWLREQMLAIIEGARPDVIVLEDYALGIRGKGLIGSLEFGGVLRLLLHEWSRMRNVPVWKIPPANLKQFTTGKGNADKPQMVMACYKRWSYDPLGSSHDLADAYALARVGHALVDPSVKTTQVERSALSKAVRLV